ncbi:MAG: hypothetical protein ACRDIF_07170, partial [Actinomycetota bacterium]
ANFGRGLEAQLGITGGLGFFQRVVPQAFEPHPGAGPSFLVPFLSNRRSDVLIGLVAASEAARGLRREVEATFLEIFGLWSEGGSWGTILAEYGVNETDLFGGLQGAIERAGLIEEGRGPGVIKPTPAPPPSRAPSPVEGRAPSPAPAPPPAPVTSPTPAPSVVEVVSEIIQGLIGILPLPPLRL